MLASCIVCGALTGRMCSTDIGSNPACLEHSDGVVIIAQRLAHCRNQVDRLNGLISGVRKEQKGLAARADRLEASLDARAKVRVVNDG